MSEQNRGFAIVSAQAGMLDVVSEVRREEAFLKTRALQCEIFNSSLHEVGI